MKLWPDSVRWRLTLWYSLVLAAMLAAFAAASWYTLERLLTTRSDRFLEEARDAFAREVGMEQREGMAPDDAVRTAASEMRFRNIILLAHDEQHHLIGSSYSSAEPDSGGAAGPPLDIQLVAAQLSDGVPRARLATVGAKSGGYRLAVTPLSVGPRRYTVTAAASRYALHETLGLSLIGFLVAIPIALGAALVGGYLLAQRALAPVAEMSRRARQISATNLHERLPIGNARDELGELAAVMNELLGRVEGFFEQQRRFVADASHELRSPVTIVRVESEVALGRDTRTVGEYRETLRVVHDVSQRLSRIVDDLFLLARADGAQQTLQRQAVYLDELAADVTRTMRSVAAQRSIRLDAGPMTEAPFVGDAELLSRMLLNLVDNAVKYSPTGARVTVGIEQEGDVYRVSVEDSGSGVPEEARAHIFDRFFRIDKIRSRTESSATSGAGLGLAIAKWVAESHGGRLELARSDGAGSTFVVTLPIPRLEE